MTHKDEATPEVWTVEETKAVIDKLLVYSGNRAIAAVYRLEDARLIAAAPALRDALRNMTPALRFGQQKPEHAADICRELEAAARTALALLEP